PASTSAPVPAPPPAAPTPSSAPEGTPSPSLSNPPLRPSSTSGSSQSPLQAGGVPIAAGVPSRLVDPAAVGDCDLNCLLEWRDAAYRQSIHTLTAEVAALFWEEYEEVGSLLQAKLGELAAPPVDTEVGNSNGRNSTTDCPGTSEWSWTMLQWAVEDGGGASGPC